MKRLAVLGASFLQRDLIKKAKELGHEVHALAWADGEVVSGEGEVDGFHDVSLRDVDAVVARCKELNVDGVTTTSSDVAVPAMAAVVKELGLCGISRKTARLCTHKGKMRQALGASNCAIPRFEVFSEFPTVLGFEPPFVVKASDRSGSRGVTVVRDMLEWEGAFDVAKRESFSGDVVVEEYFEGRQFSLEMMSHKGIHWFCGLTEEFFDVTGTSAEKGNLVPGRLSNENVSVMRGVVERALKALGIEEGPSHSEVRINEAGRCCIIEVGARMGGDFRNRLIKEAYGVDMDELAIRLALGEDVKMYDAKVRYQAMISWVFDGEDLEVLKSSVSQPFSIYSDFWSHPELGKRPTSSNARHGYLIGTSRKRGGVNWVKSELRRNKW